MKGDLAVEGATCGIEILGEETEEVEAICRVIEEIGIEIGSVNRPRGVRSEPAAQRGIVEAESKENEIFFDAFGSKAPGIRRGKRCSLCAKGVGGICCHKRACRRDKTDDMAIEIVNRDKGGTFEFDGDCGADVSLDAQAEDFELEDVA